MGWRREGVRDGLTAPDMAPFFLDLGNFSLNFSTPWATSAVVIVGARGRGPPLILAVAIWTVLLSSIDESKIRELYA